MAGNRAGHGQRIAIRVNIAGQHGNIDRRVLRSGNTVIRRDRRNIGHFPSEAERSGATTPVISRHGDGIDTIAARAALRSGIVDGAGDFAGRRIYAETGREAGRGIGQSVAVNIGKCGRSGDTDGFGIIVRLVGNRPDNRGRIVHFAHRYQHDGGIETAIAVAHLISDRIGAAEIGIGCVGDRAVRVDHNRAVSGGSAAHAERVTVRVGIVRQHIDGGRCIFQGRCGVIGRHRRRICDVEGNGLRDRAAIAVIGGDGDGVDAAIHLARRRADRSGDQACGRIDAEVCGQAGGAEGQIIAVHVAEVRAGIQRHAVRIVDVLRRNRIGHGIVVHRRDGDRGDCRGGAAFAIADRIGHGGRAVEIGRRGVDELVAHNGGLADGCSHGHQRQRIQIRIAVIGQEFDGDRRVFRRRRRIVHRNRTRVGHGVGEGLRGAEPAGISGGHGDGVDALAPGATLRSGIVQRAGDLARIGVDRQAGRQARNGIGQRIARIGIAEGARGLDRCDRIGIERGLRRQRADRDRRIVDRIDRDGDGRGRGSAFAIADRVGDGVRAVEIGVRREGDRTVRIDHNRAVAGGRAGNGQRIAIGIDIVCQHGDGDGRVFIRGCGVVVRGRWGIANGISERAAGTAAIAVTRGDGHGVHAAVHLARRIVESPGDETGDRIDD